MRLSVLTADLPWATFDRDVEVTRAVVDSRRVQPGDLFIAIRGQESDGTKFIPAAVAAGAAAVAAESDAPHLSAALVRVPDARRFAAVAAHRLAGDPTADMTLIGITGTNGKTTVTYLLESVFKALGRNVGVIGTVNYRYNGTTVQSRHTTPEAADLVAMLLEMKDAGVDTVVMEVSSHALQLQRVVGCHFDAGVFTNLTRDHLDFHGALDAYLAAKMRLFSEILPASTCRKPEVFAAVNVDDAAAAKILDAVRVRRVLYGDAETVSWRAVSCDFNGLRGRLRYGDRDINVTCPLLGDFQTYNVLAAAAACFGLGIDPQIMAAGLAKCARVPGRLDPVGEQSFLVLVDYAHTPDALDNVLATLRRLARGRIVTVFGCGGDRDQGKRPLMGAAVAQRSDLSIVTSDNPRGEDPLSIIDMILPGVRETGLPQIAPEQISQWRGQPIFVVEPDRAAAIRLAVRAARPGDVVLIAGKGHEDYQIIGRERIPFDDHEVARAALAECRGAI